MVKKKFDCKSCDEDGYTTTWESDKKTDEYLEIKDCDVCDGKGHIYFEVKDIRKISKKKKLVHTSEY